MKNFKVNTDIFLMLLILLFCGQVRAGNSNLQSFFEFSDTVPLSFDLDKAFVGRDGENLVVLGGFKSQDSKAVANNAVFVLSADSKQWKEVSQLRNHIYGGAAVSTSDGIVCIGGYKDGQLTKVVVRYSIQDGQLKTEQMPDLPVAISDVKATIVSNQIYAIGSENAFVMDLLASDLKWHNLEGWRPTRSKVAAVVGVLGELFVFLQEDQVEILSLSDNNIFEQVDQTNHNLSDIIAIPCGQAHVLFVSRSGQSDDILAYHTITNKWVVLGKLPKKIKPVGIVTDDLEFEIIGSDDSIKVKAIMPATKYGWIDHSVVFISMVGLLIIGAYLSKREKSSKDYFRGSKSIPWWASGLSLFATGASAITLMAMPGKAFATDWFYMGTSIYAIIILPLSMYVYMPIARRLKVATANEYLERRYNIFLRMAGSIIFSLLQIIGRMGAIMILPAIAINSITGVTIETSIIIMGVVTTIYVFLGGLEGVVWTNVIQAFVMLFAVFACAFWALTSLDMGMSEAWTNIQSAQKLHMFDWEVSLLKPCVTVLFLNSFITFLGLIGDQNFIQRVQCTSNEREAKKAVVMQMAVAIPLNAFLFGLGTILFLFYLKKPEMLSPAVKADGIFPLFAAHKLPIGFAGLVIAAILAATMSTLASAINSVANIGVEDFYRRFKKGVSDHSCVILGRILTAILGVLGTVIALLLAKTNLSSIWDLFMVVFGLLSGAITGIFTLGIFTKRANSVGAMIGAIASLFATYYAMNYTHLHFLAYPIVGVVTCYIVGYLSSIIIPLKPKEIIGLTVYTLQKSEE